MKRANTNEPWLDKLPMGWTRSRIRNVAKLSPWYSDGQPAATEGCAVVPMEMLSEDGRIDLSEVQPFQEVAQSLTVFEKGDVLFAKITPCMENGKGAFVAGFAYTICFWQHGVPCSPAF